MSVKPPTTQPIIIVKKVQASGSHGGAWKVAYADFVTAMMALFIVLWLMNASPEIQKAVSLYFSDPRGFQNMHGSGKLGTEYDKALLLSKEDMPTLKDALEHSLAAIPELDNLKEQVDMTVTGEGLRIELLDKEGTSFFDSGSRELTSAARLVVTALSSEISKIENPIVIEGHTDARPYSSNNFYSNWDLSTDRANYARRFMEQNGIHPSQIAQVRGYADRQLRNPANPNDYANRRVSIIVGFAESSEGHEGRKAESATHPGDSANATPAHPSATP